MGREAARTEEEAGQMTATKRRVANTGNFMKKKAHHTSLIWRCKARVWIGRDEGEATLDGPPGVRLRAEHVRRPELTLHIERNGCRNKMGAIK